MTSRKPVFDVDVQCASLFLRMLFHHVPPDSFVLLSSNLVTNGVVLQQDHWWWLARSEKGTITEHNTTEPR